MHYGVLWLVLYLLDLKYIVLEYSRQVYYGPNAASLDSRPLEVSM